MRRFSLFPLILAFAALVAADTEQINFKATPHPADTLSELPVIGAHYNVAAGTTTRLVLKRSQLEAVVSLALETEEGTAHGYTARLSWPTSTHCQFDLKFQSHPDPSNQTQHVLYITARPIGIPLPRGSLLQLSSSPDIEEMDIAVDLTVEELVGGVLPRTAVPTILGVLAAAGVGYWASNGMIHVMDRIYV